MTLYFLDSAAAEAVEAAAYYRSVSSHLAEQFTASLKQALALIEQ